jgi:uncharacterized protein
MRFNVSYLLDAPVGAQGTIQLDERNIMLVDGLFVHHVAGDMLLTRVDNGLLVEGELDVTIEAECVRCLTDFPLRFNFELDDLIFALPFVPKSVNPYRVMEDGWLNPLPALSEQIWLAVPLQALCKPDCRGLCDQCGVDLNAQTCQCEDESIDPRLAILKELL